MEPMRWLREDVDERLEGLFSDNADFVHKTVGELIHYGRTESEVVELLIETIERGLTEQNDETMGLAWIAVVLGELRSEEAVGALTSALASTDEVLVSAATRALQRIGEPALETALELIEDENISSDVYVACAETLEGVALHPGAELREQVEDTLLSHVRLISKTEVGPGSDPPGLGRTRKLEAAALALARLGVERARDAIESAESTSSHANLFLREALDILEEEPKGIPCRAGVPWETEYRWALWEELPGGELDPFDDEDDSSPEPDDYGGSRLSRF